MEKLNKIPNHIRGNYNEDVHVWRRTIFHFITVDMKKKHIFK